jgi:hypothetical protein
MLLERSETEQGSSNHFVSATQMQQSPVTLEIVTRQAVHGESSLIVAHRESSVSEKSYLGFNCVKAVPDSGDDAVASLNCASSARTRKSGRSFARAPQPGF